MARSIKTDNPLCLYKSSILLVLISFFCKDPLDFLYSRAFPNPFLNLPQKIPETFTFCKCFLHLSGHYLANNMPMVVHYMFYFPQYNGIERYILAFVSNTYFEVIRGESRSSFFEMERNVLRTYLIKTHGFVIPCPWIHIGCPHCLRFD